LPYQLTITGGTNGGSNIDSILNSVETLTTAGWQGTIPHIPVRLYFHCAANLNSTTFVVVGGVTDSYGEDSQKMTFFFNSETKEWTQGPPIKTGRYHHSCARILDNGQVKFSLFYSNNFDFSDLY
jgi:hypothetical protein